MLKDKLKSLIAKGDQGDNKKKIENLAVFVIILIVTLVVINLIWGSDTSKTKQETQNDPNKKLAASETTQSSVTTANLNTQDTLSLQLEEILKKIEGVGEVKVLITYSQTSQTVPMYNEDTTQKDTEEKDTSRWNKESD